MIGGLFCDAWKRSPLHMVADCGSSIVRLSCFVENEEGVEFVPFISEENNEI